MTSYLNLVASPKIECHTFFMKVVAPFNKKILADDSQHEVSFNRKELEPILRLYGQMVSLGEWRDYSISCSSSNAIFSVFRRSAEKPLFMIIKAPKLAKQNRMYSIMAMDRGIIKYGKDLNPVLQILNKKLFKIV